MNFYNIQNYEEMTMGQLKELLKHNQIKITNYKFEKERKEKIGIIVIIIYGLLSLTFVPMGLYFAFELSFLSNILGCFFLFISIYLVANIHFTVDEDNTIQHFEEENELIEYFIEKNKTKEK